MGESTAPGSADDGEALANADRGTLLTNALVGAAVTLVLSFLPFSSVAGGAVAAYRQDVGYGGGLTVGAVAGLVAAVPLLVLFVPALYVASLFGFGVPPGSPAYEAFLAITFGLFFLYTVGLSAVGGAVGAWALAKTDWNLDPGRSL